MAITEINTFKFLDNKEIVIESSRIDEYVVGIEQLECLKILRLYNYHPKSKSIVELNELSSIEELKITNSSIETFKGCNKLINLKKLELNYLKKLCYIDELEKISNNLKVLEFNSCKKIKNHEYVLCLKNLEKLAFNECSELENIRFIKDMHKLRSFVFLNTNVIDGDLSFCENLEYVAFTNKKHFSNKMSDFKN